ncbi:MAG: hypothetical protein U9R68_01225 [Planctomycetota bacterium]|nr:hypothetical protein [Planctomycetota bacterium]
MRVTMRILGVLALAAGAARGAGERDGVFSTWFGGAEEDRLTAVVVLTDGSILVGGDAEGEGALVRLSAGGRKVLSRRRTDGPVSDMALAADGRVLAVGGFGVVALSPDAQKILWSCTAGAKGARVAAGPNGDAVVLAEKRVTVVGADGKARGTWAVKGGYVEDVACDAERGRIFVTGFDNKRGHKNPVQVAFVYAYDATGKRVWKAYGWGGKEVDDRHLMADTRGYRLAMGGDGKLYVAGESAGGNTMWSRQSQDLDEKADLVKGDKYQHAYNTSANHITYVGRLDPEAGRSEGGTLLLARLSNNKGNTIRPRALAADARGNIFVGGMSAYGCPISEGAFGAADPRGAWFCVFDKALTRRYATTFGNGRTAAIALGPAAVVAVGEAKEGVVPAAAFQKEPGGGTDGWIVALQRK